MLIFVDHDYDNIMLAVPDAGIVPAEDLESTEEENHLICRQDKESMSFQILTRSVQ